MRRQELVAAMQILDENDVADEKMREVARLAGASESDSSKYLPPLQLPSTAHMASFIQVSPVSWSVPCDE